MDLFRPLFLPFVARHERFGAMLQAAMSGNPSGLIYMPPEQKAWLEGKAQISNEQILDLYRLDPREFEPVLNVLVVESGSAELHPRYEIRSGDKVLAAAGLNWIGPKFAELYLEFEPEAQPRKFPHSVLSSACAFLLDQSKIPLLRLKQLDQPSRAVALDFGFKPVGNRTLFAELDPLKKNS
jgi:hypothetical protein